MYTFNGVLYLFNEGSGIARVDGLFGASIGNVTILSSFTVKSITYNVTSIEFGAFEYCTNLTSVTIPSSVTSIGGAAFANCSGLTSINIPSSVTTIGNNAFLNCTALTTITIPSSVTNIGNSAFQGCTLLLSVIFNGNIPTIGANNFNITGDTAYYYLGASDLSRLSMFTFTQKIPLAPTITSVSGLSISFSQTPSDTSITNYHYSIDGTTYTALSPAQTTSPLTIPVTGLTSGSSYTFSIKAINPAGSSSASNSVPSTFYMPPTAPTITNVSGLSISFSQTPSDTSITNYSYSIDGTNYTALSPSQTSSPLTIPVTGLKFGSLYTYRIKSINLAGSSTSSNGIAKTMTTITPCFKDDTKILTDKGYVQIKDLKNGDLIETFVHGLKPITAIGRKQVIHLASPDRNPEQLYKYTNNTHSSLFEDLVITGRHAILVDDFVSDEQRDNVSNFYKGVLKTDGKYLLPSSLDITANVYEVTGEYCVYHLALQNDDENMNYGIYANGLLVETASERYLKNHSKMELIK